MRWPAWLGALLVLAGAGCSSDTVTGVESVPGLTLEASVDQASDPARVTLVLRNESEYGLSYNLCFASLMRRRGLRWESTRWHPEYTACIAIAYYLASGESGTYSQELFPLIAPGRYRFIAKVHWTGRDGTSEVASNQFLVRAP